MNNKDILVTGSHRSGSTWVGSTLALPQKVTYIYEPFNQGTHYRGAPLQYWFEYISVNDSLEKQEAFKKYMKRFLYGSVKGWADDMLRIDSFGEFKAFLKRYYGYVINNRVLLKDPLAVMSVEWLVENFDLAVVIVIRHPAAFAASLKVKNWNFDFTWFSGQHKLIEESLSPFRKEIERLSASNANIIDQAILLWNIIHYQIRMYEEAHPEWIFVKHEDLSANPVEQFQRLYQQLQLTFTPHVEDQIMKMTQASEKNTLKRDSKENIYSWKNRLSPEEITRIHKGTHSISRHYYSENEW
uniref:Sulfotransferase n=1 Tax=Roseihalotalea indica TaxID=2867963 RepID=A0AA49JJY9_9BACT|nr:sulfotransferase [Tunicatimonas sp. TK19036]